MKLERPNESVSAGSSPDNGKWRYLSDAIETVLSLGDFQKRSLAPYSVLDFCEMALGGMDKIAPFDSSAIFLIDEDTSDLSLAAVIPAARGAEMEAQITHLIDEGTVAWAIRERRGITVLSQDGRNQLFLHAVATYARIRGLFIGILPVRKGAVGPRLPDGALELLSLFLRSVATSLESIAYIDLLGRQNQALQKQVDEKMRLILRHERALANTRKLNAIASLAGGIAHEYNNALMSLMGYCELAKMDLQDHPSVLKHLDKTEPVVERMAHLTTQLLAYSRGGKYRKEAVDLRSLVNEVLAKIEGLLNGAVKVTVAFEDDGPEADEDYFKIQGDLNQLRQALTAVVANASEALGSGGDIRVRMCRVVGAEVPEDTANRLTEGDVIFLEVEDNGCGMDQETQERMFEPFFSTKFAGRGLSLAAVYGIVENHNGVIAVDSQVDRGTKLQLYLPVQHFDPQERPAL